MPDDMVLSDGEKSRLHILLIREMRAITGSDEHLWCSNQLVDLYNRSDEFGRRTINETLMAVSCWDLPGLIKQVRRKEGGKDE